MDDRLRRLERAYRESGTHEDGAALLRERERAGTLARERLELAAHVGHPAARLALGLAVARSDGEERLPARLFAPGVVVPLASSPEGLSLDARTLDADLTVELTLDGALNSDATWLLRGLDELAACGVRRLVLHVGGVIYAGSTALGALVRVSDRLTRAGGGVVLVGARQPVRVLVEMLGLAQFLPFFDDAAAALAALPVPSSQAAEPRAWLLRLARWGREPCVRAALAACAGEQTRAAEVAREWLRCPCAAHRREARDVTVRAGQGWDVVAATVAGVGTWPLGLAEGALLDDEAAVRAAVSAWSLGLAPR